MSRIGLKIKSIRTSKGLTHKQLGKAIGVSDRFIEEVESGKRVLSDDLIKRVSKVFEQDISEVMSFDVEAVQEVVRDVKIPKKLVEPEVQKVWNDAFDSILKTIPVYDYTLTNSIDTKQLPIVSNKVEGYPKDKVAYIEIQDNEMIGFRIVKGDLAFIHLTHEIENNSICLVEYNGQRVLRQLKKLDSEKVLLVSNKGTLVTEAISVKNIKVLARLVKLEIRL